MGKNAKVHKRLKKKTVSSIGGQNAASSSHTQVQAAKEKAGRKDKLKTKTAGKGEDGVLGGADYVSLMMGGRRKAREEARKLPNDE